MLIVPLDRRHRCSGSLIALAKGSPRRHLQNLPCALALHAALLAEVDASVTGVTGARFPLREVHLDVADAGFARSRAHIRVPLVLLVHFFNGQLRPVSLDRQWLQLTGHVRLSSGFLVVVVRVGASFTAPHPFHAEVLAVAQLVVELS